MSATPTLFDERQKVLVCRAVPTGRANVQFNLNGQPKRIGAPELVDP